MISAVQFVHVGEYLPRLPATTLGEMFLKPTKSIENT